jgi:hypothetical protein
VISILLVNPALTGKNSQMLPKIALTTNKTKQPGKFIAWFNYMKLEESVEMPGTIFYMTRVIFCETQKSDFAESLS